jgi:hypothetical protein
MMQINPFLGFQPHTVPRFQSPMRLGGGQIPKIPQMPPLRLGAPGFNPFGAQPKPQMPQIRPFNALMGFRPRLFGQQPY